MTQNQTQSGHSAQTRRSHLRRVTVMSMIATMSASAAWRLGIAAYGFGATSTRPLPWFIELMLPRVSMKPSDWNIRGGAVGRRT